MVNRRRILQLLIAATLLQNLLVSRWRERDMKIANAIDRNSRWAFPATYAALVALLAVAYRV